MQQDMEILASHTIHTGKTPATLQAIFMLTFVTACVPYFSCIWLQAIARRFDISLDLFKKSNTTGLAGNFP